jgi:predicted lactoylglutathione lyase
MVTQIFINLPIHPTEKSNPFFEQLVFNFNPLFSNEVGSCIEKFKIKCLCIQQEFQI